jgi:hypothetical protein
MAESPRNTGDYQHAGRFGMKNSTADYSSCSSQKRVSAAINVPVMGNGSAKRLSRRRGLIGL